MVDNSDKGLGKYRRLREPSSESELSLLSFDLYDLNRWASTCVDPSCDFDYPIVIRDRLTVGSIWQSGEHPRIEIHPLLNTPWTPIGVIRHVLVHLHLHRVVPPLEISPGVVRSHHPEFWTRLKELNPEGIVAWTWMMLEWHKFMKSDPEFECVWVKRNWKRERDIRERGMREAIGNPGSNEARSFVTSWEDAVEKYQSYKISDEFLI